HSIAALGWRLPGEEGFGRVAFWIQIRSEQFISWPCLTPFLIPPIVPTLLLTSSASARENALLHDWVSGLASCHRYCSSPPPPARQSPPFDNRTRNDLCSPDSSHASFQLLLRSVGDGCS
ncbi:unnamed protein product, partial [Allacma fusca]